MLLRLMELVPERNFHQIKKCPLLNVKKCVLFAKLCISSLRKNSIWLDTGLSTSIQCSEHWLIQKMKDCSNLMQVHLKLTSILYCLNLRVESYFNKILSKAQWNCGATKKELLSVSVKHYHLSYMIENALKTIMPPYNVFAVWKNELYPRISC